MFVKMVLVKAVLNIAQSTLSQMHINNFRRFRCILLNENTHNINNVMRMVAVRSKYLSLMTSP